MSTVTGVGSILMSEFRNKTAQQMRLGVSSAVDACLARMNVPGVRQMEGFSMTNGDRGAVTITMKKRGKEYVLLAEVISALRVGATNQFRGKLVKRRVKPKSVLITDTSVTAQQVEDTNGDGRLFQIAGAVGPTYPQQVGTINYNDGILDFTFMQTVTLPVQLDYTHSDWTAFGTPVTFNLAAGGGSKQYVIVPDNAENWVDSIKGELEIGWWGKLLSAAENKSSVSLEVVYFGDDSKIQLPIKKGEIDDYPFHNA